MSPRVFVSIVTCNSAPYLQRCLESVKNQTHPYVAASLWDNASSDRTPEIAAEFGAFLQTTHFSAQNIGFCAAHNRLIRAVDSDYVLVLNPDVMLNPPYIELLVAALDADPASGSATGKLIRWNGISDGPPHPAILDSTGIYFTPSQRHLDRGSGEIDTGRYERPEYVFGVSGAAGFYRRRMLNDVAVDGDYFDESFFAYREDADLAWRAQWLGWRCLYVPKAQALHVRRVLPERRASLPADINMHSFKNRFLMRLKNMDTGTYLRFFLSITARDLGALVYVLARERSSLRAFPRIAQAAPRAWAVRKALRRHRRVPAKEIRSWFSNRPVSKPLVRIE